MSEATFAPNDPDVMVPIPVTFDRVEQLAPEFASFARFLGVGGAQAVQILPEAPKRKRAIIKLTAVTGGAKAIVGSIGQVGNGATGTALQGFQFTAATDAPLEYTARGALFVIADTVGQTVDISVMDERYR